MTAMMILPLQEILDVSLRDLSVVFDNACSPASPVSFRRKAKKKFGDIRPLPKVARGSSSESSVAASRWTSVPSTMITSMEAETAEEPSGSPMISSKIDMPPPPPTMQRAVSLDSNDTKLVTSPQLSGPVRMPRRLSSPNSSRKVLSEYPPHWIPATDRVCSPPPKAIGRRTSLDNTAVQNVPRVFLLAAPMRQPLRMLSPRSVTRQKTPYPKTRISLDDTISSDRSMVSIDHLSMDTETEDSSTAMLSVDRRGLDDSNPFGDCEVGSASDSNTETSSLFEESDDDFFGSIRSMSNLLGKEKGSSNALLGSNRTFGELVSRGYDDSNPFGFSFSESSTGGVDPIMPAVFPLLFPR